MGSLAFAARLMDEAGVVVAPGAGFGAAGDGFVRLSMTSSLEGIERAVAKIAEIAPWK
jgi:LL-diaminopimelate aminotransferase